MIPIKSYLYNLDFDEKNYGCDCCYCCYYDCPYCVDPK